MAASTQSAFLTLSEYGSQPGMVGVKDELIEGERVLSPMAHLAHTAVLKHLGLLLEQQLEALSEEPLCVLQEAGWNLGLVAGRDSVPGPDILVVRNDEYRNALRQGGWLTCKPLFVVEVVSPSERRSRRMQKVGLYLEAGAAAVVEVNYTRRSLLVYRADEDLTVQLVRDGSIEWPFRAALAEIFSVLD